MDDLYTLWATRLRDLDCKAERSSGDAKITLQAKADELNKCILDFKTQFPEKGNATERRMFIKLELDCPQVSDLGRLINQKLDLILRKEARIKMTLDETLEKVKEETAVEQGLVVLTTDIKKRLDEALAGNLTPEQQAKVDAIFAEIEANRQAAADAIVANTDAAPTA